MSGERKRRGMKGRKWKVKKLWNNKKKKK